MSAPVASKRPPRHDTPASNSMLDTDASSNGGILNLALKEPKPASKAGFLSGARISAMSLNQTSPSAAKAPPP